MSTRSLNSKLRKTMSLRASAAWLVAGCLGLGVYTTVAEGNDPELNPVNAMNDVLFVGVVGALIDNKALESARADRALVNRTSVNRTFVNRTLANRVLAGRALIDSAPTDSAPTDGSTVRVASAGSSVN